MVKGPKKHLKRLAAPRHWLLSKTGGIWAPRPRDGPHALRECIPLTLILRAKLKYALSRQEVSIILMQRYVKIDHKVRTDSKFPVGFMDVVQIKKTKENFRVLIDTKGRFVLKKINAKEAEFKLLRVKNIERGTQGIPLLTSHDNRVIRYPDPEIKANDTVKYDLKQKKIVDFVKFKVGNVCYITGGLNRGRIGELVSIEKHPGSFDVCHIKDVKGNTFATRSSYVFIIGPGHTAWVTLPKGGGVRLTKFDDRKRKLNLMRKEKKKVVSKKSKGKKKHPKKDKKEDKEDKKEDKKEEKKEEKKDVEMKDEKKK